MALHFVRNRFVALFDVLGFSERVEQHGARGLLDSYVEKVLQAASPFQDTLGLILFSDSIVAYTADDKTESFEQVTSFASELLYTLILSGVPVRGAVSHGEIVGSDNREHGNFIAGRPVIEAYRFESQQQWIGVVLTPSVHQRFPDLPARPNFGGLKGEYPSASTELLKAVVKRLRIQRTQNVPLEPTKGTITTYDGYAIVPTAPFKPQPHTTNPVQALEQVLGTLDKLMRRAPEARSQAKYRSTIRWLTEIREEVEGFDFQFPV
jgi:hypothetical protein